MICLCRTLFLLIFALFWGGLTFYTGFVVRISHDVLDDAMTGGLITQRVTQVLQGLGVIVAVLMAINSNYANRHSQKWGKALIVVTIIFICVIVGLFAVHSYLDAVIDVGAAEITDDEAFTVGHRRYNQLTTIEWLASIAYLVMTIKVWRSIDATTGGPTQA